MKKCMSLQDSVQTMDLEDAYAFAETLTETERRELSGLTVFTGMHPDYGAVSVVIPAFGEGIIFYPFVSQYDT